MAYDFSKQSDVEILNFINEHFHLFSEDCSGFNLQKMVQFLESGAVFIRKMPQGFAVAHLEREQATRDELLPATIHFIYVQPEYEGQGFAKQLIGGVISEFSSDTRIELVCEGEDRKGKFEKMGFQLCDVNDSEENGYCLYTVV